MSVRNFLDRGYRDVELAMAESAHCDHRNGSKPFEHAKSAFFHIGLRNRDSCSPNAGVNELGMRPSRSARQVPSPPIASKTHPQSRTFQCLLRLSSQQYNWPAIITHSGQCRSPECNRSHKRSGGGVELSCSPQSAISLEGHASQSVRVQIAAPVVATRKCRINCNETLSPLSELGHGGYRGATAEVVDAGHRFFCFLWADARSGAG